MARRKPSYIKKKSGVYAATKGAGLPMPGNGACRVSVLEAAEIFKAKAIKNAAAFSRSIPLATYVAGIGEQNAEVITDGVLAPMAAPFEFGERHPGNWPSQIAAGRNGRSGEWFKQPLRPYMARAATNSATVNAAADIYLKREAELLAEASKYLELD